MLSNCIIFSLLLSVLHVFKVSFLNITVLMAGGDWIILMHSVVCTINFHKDFGPRLTLMSMVLLLPSLQATKLTCTKWKRGQNQGVVLRICTLVSGGMKWKRFCFRSSKTWVKCSGKQSEWWKKKKTKTKKNPIETNISLFLSEPLAGCICWITRKYWCQHPTLLSCDIDICLCSTPHACGT